MKAILPDRSLIVKDRLDAVVKEILAVGKKKISMIILYGSYARGDWVQEDFEPGTRGRGYQSDFDILVILKKGKHAGYQSIDLTYKIYDRLDDRFLEETMAMDIKERLKVPSVSLIVEPITRVNEQLGKGRYFFSDIKKEGVLLYDTGEYELVEAKKLPREEVKQIAQIDYDKWFKAGSEFFIDYKYPMARGNYPLSAFYLHQATENFYNAIELVFLAYKSKTHDLVILRGKTRIFHSDLIDIFPLHVPEWKKCFELLRDAYVKGRYDPYYTITKEQLHYLIERVEKLKILTEKICLERISKI